MESSRAAAKDALNDTLGRLEKLLSNPGLVDERLILNAVTPHPQVFETTFGREVSALISTPDVIPSRTHTPVHLAVVLRIARRSPLVYGELIASGPKHGSFRLTSRSFRYSRSASLRVNWYCRSSFLSTNHELTRSDLDSQNVKMTDESFGFAPSTLVSKGSDAALGQSKY